MIRVLKLYKLASGDKCGEGLATADTLSLAELDGTLSGGP